MDTGWNWERVEIDLGSIRDRPVIDQRSAVDLGLTDDRPWPIRHPQ